MPSALGHPPFDRSLYLTDRDAPVQRPLLRVLLHAQRLHDSLDGSVDALLKNDARTHLFMLQSLVRLYAPQAKTKAHDKRLTQVKELEDALGTCGYCDDMIAMATSARASPAVLQLLRGNATAARADAEVVLQAGWRIADGSSRRLKKLVEHFASLDTMSGHIGDEDRDASFVRNQLRGHLRDVDEADYDMDDLEEGIHELRRQLRWIPITLMALDGLVVLDAATDPIAELTALKRSASATSRFGVLPTSAREMHCIKWSQSLFLELSRTIDVLGAIKDRGQRIVGLAHALIDAEGDAPHDAVAHAEALLSDRHGLVRVQADARAVYATLRGLKLLKVSRRALKE